MKIPLKILTITFLSLMLFGCGPQKPKLYVYNWSYYIPKEVISGFEKKYDVRVVYDVFSSNEEMFAKLKAGGTGYDITFPSDDYVTLMSNLGLLEKLDHSKLPALKQLDPIAKKKMTFDPQQTYCLPFFMGASGVAVNTKYVKNFTPDMHIYERQDLKGKMTLLDDMREVMGAALKTLGYSVNTLDPKQLAAAKDLIIKWKSNILKFDSSSFAKGYANGEFWVVQCYAENVYLELDDVQKQNFKFYIPKTGGPLYMDTMVLLKTSKNKELAYTFMNYLHEPEVYAQIADYLHLPSLNTGARKYTKEQPIYELKDMQKCEISHDLGKDVTIYNKIWEEIHVGGN